MNFKKLAIGLGVGLALGCAAAQAQQVIRFQDDDVDFLLTSTLQPKTTGSFAVGDVLVSVFEMPTYTIGGVNQIPAGMELTGLAAIQITGGDGSLASPFTFSAYTGGFNAISPVDVQGGAAGEGATAVMWLNSTTNFDLQLDFAQNVTTNCTSLAQCMAEATTGDLVQIDGFFNNDADNFWQSTLAILGGANVDTVRGTAGDITVASFLAAQTTLFNATGPIAFRNIQTGLPCPGGTTALDGCVQGPVITGPISGGAGLNPALYADGAFARSDIDASKLLATPVPEPATLALLGVSLLGFAATRRRGQK